MPRTNFNQGSEIIVEDHNELQSRLEKEMFDRVIFKMVQGLENAFFDTSFAVSRLSGSSVQVAAGSGFQTDATVDDAEPQKRHLYLASAVTKTLTAAHASLNRIDIVSVKAERVATLTESRKYKDPDTSVISDEDFDVETDWEADVVVTNGTASGSPSAPSTPTGYVKIAELLITAVTGLASSNDITDSRVKLGIGGDVRLNTAALVRITAGSATKLDTVLSDIDALLKNGNQEYTAYEDLEADPSAPVTSDYHRFYFKDQMPYYRPTGGSAIPLRGKTVAEVSADTTFGEQDTLVVDCTGGNKTVTMPAIASNLGRIRRVIKKDSSSNTLTIARDGSSTFVGALTSIVLEGQGETGAFQESGTIWYQV